jgi:hypothetical protein
LIDWLRIQKLPGGFWPQPYEKLERRASILERISAIWGCARHNYLDCAPPISLRHPHKLY